MKKRLTDEQLIELTNDLCDCLEENEVSPKEAAMLGLCLFLFHCQGVGRNTLESSIDLFVDFYKELSSMRNIPQ